MYSNPFYRVFGDDQTLNHDSTDYERDIKQKAKS